MATDGSIHGKILSDRDHAKNCRQEKLKAIGDHFGGKVAFAYYTSFIYNGSGISNVDVAPIEDILKTSDCTNGLLLILSSPGGDGLAAERIINVCRQYAPDSFEVLVPKMAKSAATMISFGARTIHLSQTSELGPIDPQVPVTLSDGQTEYLPADIAIKTYDDLVSEANVTTGNLDPYLQQLQYFDARQIALYKRSQQLGLDIAISALKSGMMTGRTNSQISNKIKPFTDAERTSSHGRPIFAQAAKACGLNITDVNIQDEIWADIMEFHVRADFLVSSSHAKLLETAQHHFSMPVRKKS